MNEPYELIYWPFTPGRGEFIRLILEDSGADYVDVARLPESGGGGIPAVLAARGDSAGVAPPFAPPVLRAGPLVIGQTAVIADFLATRHGLAPAGEAGGLAARQVMLTILDVVDEAHDTHHPITSALTFEEQRDAAIEAGRAFANERLPAWLGYFDRLLGDGRRWLLGDTASYVDLALFQLVEGLEYAFPNAMRRNGDASGRVRAVRDRVRERPRIAAYLSSDRRVAFNEDGIFRRYPELDP